MAPNWKIQICSLFFHFSRLKENYFLKKNTLLFILTNERDDFTRKTSCWLWRKCNVKSEVYGIDRIVRWGKNEKLPHAFQKCSGRESKISVPLALECNRNVRLLFISQFS